MKWNENIDKQLIREIPWRLQIKGKSLLIFNKWLYTKVFASLNLYCINSCWQLTDFNGKSFAVFCTRQGDHDFQSNDVERHVGGLIYTYLEKKSFKPKVNLTNPDVIVRIFMNESKFYVGIDFAGFDVSSPSSNIHWQHELINVTWSKMHFLANTNISII